MSGRACLVVALVSLGLSAALLACSSKSASCNSSSRCDTIRAEIFQHGARSGSCIDPAAAPEFGTACRALGDCLGCGNACAACDSLFADAGFD
jgi:hypothetical protein